MSRQSQMANMMAVLTSTTDKSDTASGAKGSVANRIKNIEIGKIFLNPKQHRKYFDPKEQRKLQNSIEKNGFQGHILLRPLPDSLSKIAIKEHEYELVYGESRVRAVEALGWETIPAAVKDLNDEEVHRIRLDENLIRKDLNPLEEMNGLLEVAADELGLSTKQILKLLDDYDHATRKGREPAGDVARNAIRLQSVLDYYDRGTLQGFRTKYRKLQKLPDDIREAVKKHLDWSKAVEIAPIKDTEERTKVLKWAVKHNPSVKDIRAKRKEIRAEALQSKSADSPSKTDIQQRLRRCLQKAEKSNVWNDTGKWDQLEKLLKKLEELIET